ncbi:MAG: hypothetical protein J6N18_00300 [Kiritimatiellae bacterium]|nr:hypothetical protein [Kiritimatiellia bacterium]MBR3821185.1 hypothetical protein [Kiritimatiellia bacterium]
MSVIFTVAAMASSAAFALPGTSASAGDASLSPIRLTPAKIPGCSKAHVCNDLQYCRSMPGLSPILTAGYSNTTPRRVRGSTETSENT